VTSTNIAQSQWIIPSQLNEVRKQAERYASNTTAHTVDMVGCYSKSRQIKTDHRKEIFLRNYAICLISKSKDEKLKNILEAHIHTDNLLR
jgi:hypothetical protein